MYVGKSKFVQAIDTLSRPVRAIFGGRDLDVANKTESELNVAHRIGALLVSIILFPIGIGSLITFGLKLLTGDKKAVTPLIAKINSVAVSQGIQKSITNPQNTTHSKNITNPQNTVHQQSQTSPQNSTYPQRSPTQKSTTNKENSSHSQKVIELSRENVKQPFAAIQKGNKIVDSDDWFDRVEEKEELWYLEANIRQPFAAILKGDKDVIDNELKKYGEKDRLSFLHNILNILSMIQVSDADKVTLVKVIYATLAMKERTSEFEHLFAFFQDQSFLLRHYNQKQYRYLKSALEAIGPMVKTDHKKFFTHLRDGVGIWNTYNMIHWMIEGALNAHAKDSEAVLRSLFLGKESEVLADLINEANETYNYPLCDEVRPTYISLGVENLNGRIIYNNLNDKTHFFLYCTEKELIDKVKSCLSDQEKTNQLSESIEWCACLQRQSHVTDEDLSELIHHLMSQLLVRGKLKEIVDNLSTECKECYLRCSHSR